MISQLLRKINTRTVDTVFDILNFSLLFDIYVSFFFLFFIFHSSFLFLIFYLTFYIFTFFFYISHFTFIYRSRFILFYYFWLGIGPKTALRLIKQHGRIEDIVAALMKVKWYEILFTSEIQITRYYILIFIFKTFI